MKPRIMYIEPKEGASAGKARIGLVTFSKTGATLYYRGRTFQSLKGAGFKANYFEVETGEHYWISGPRRDGHDSLYPTNVQPEVDEEVQVEYWCSIRGMPSPPSTAKNQPGSLAPATSSFSNAKGA